MIFKKLSHKSAERIITAQLAEQTEAVLTNANLELVRRSSAKVRSELLESLQLKGWSDKVRISAKRGLTLTAKYGKTALCLQTGNMARFYADLLKLQAQFIDGKISSAIYVIPTKAAAKKMGDNLANFERLTEELTDLFSKVITVPLLIYGFE